MLKQRQLLRFSTVLWCCFFLISCSDSLPTLRPLASNAVIVAFGDSLTFGTGANSQAESYPAVLQQLTGRTVINAGIPGEISQQGLLRLPLILEQTKPDLVVLCHGGNDLIRKLGNDQLKNNLEKMIGLIQKSGAEVLLIAVPRFSINLAVPDLYTELATTYNLPIELTILAELERNSAMKSDTIHPNSVGYKLLAERIRRLIFTAGGL
ncbi:MAG: acyl-CoA thioesterase-1 [Methylophagaceae bacterium]|jgi:acyl-CoA thioesterase-1